ncbi:uncharacterized protein LOC129725797 [Wyeomyia smithii]|uniref:uncharacterized protein LOC129725797 n=1 Tax=Wyeomyia smithii TaxID=174621 RepID=UPI002467D323|nr:uncharacterized protein LOC129725797 [Wyeomyia smithii]
MILWYIRTLFLVQSFLEIYAFNTPYRVYDMIPQGICKMRRIPLLDNFLTQIDPILLNAEQGAIFQQTWNSSSFKKYSDCKFYVQAPPHMGLYLTVSKVQLRKNRNDNCIDTLVVKKSNDKKHQFCETPDDEPKVLYDNRGRMRITVNLDANLALPLLEDTLEVQVIVTVKRKCDVDGYLPCEEDENDSCISKYFFGDGFVNCPNCLDEKGCVKDNEQVQIFNPSNVFFSAIISLLGTMIVFGGCLWCVYRHRHCIATCNSNNSAEAVRSSHINRNSLDSATVDQIQVELHATSQPTAPPEEDKDLPPSYDSLFPVPSTAR